jgi:hypothetical protein
MVKRFLMSLPFFSFDLSSSSGIATCTALRAIIKLSLDHTACRIRALHATPTILAIYRWENLI